MERRVRQLLGRNTRTAGLFEARVADRRDGFPGLTWTKRESWRQRVRLSADCYPPCRNLRDRKPEE